MNSERALDKFLDRKIYLLASDIINYDYGLMMERSREHLPLNVLITFIHVYFLSLLVACSLLNLSSNLVVRRHYQ
jgi:hypothetical protein